MDSKCIKLGAAPTPWVHNPISFVEIDLAKKLNLKCHMSYIIILFVNNGFQTHKTLRKWQRRNEAVGA